MSKNLEMMKKIIEEKKMKGKDKPGHIIPSRYSNQSNGSGKISSSDYGK